MGCAIDNCAADAHARGMCRPHYRAWARANPDLVRRYSRRGPCCVVDGCCGTVKADGMCSFHYARSRAYGSTDGPRRTCEHCGDHFTPHGRQRWCEGCTAGPYGTGRLRRYGISAMEYEAILLSQDGVCAICRADVKLVVEHDHETHRVRGLVCYGCNARLQVVDDPGWLEAALLYVKGGG